MFSELDKNLSRQEKDLKIIDQPKRMIDVNHVANEIKTITVTDSS